MTEVPPNSVCLSDPFSVYTSVDISGKQLFITGMLSPVSIASFTIAVPVSRIRSQGKLAP